MLRLTALWLVVSGILVLSWKDWYKGLCGAILLMAVEEHPDMPKSLLGIPGLNAWNLVFFNVVLAWFVQRRREQLRWDMPRHLNVMLLAYLIVVLVGWVRIIGDTEMLVLVYDADMTYFFNEWIINTIKWVIPGLLLYDGCRTEKRFRMAAFSILFIYFFLGVQVAKWMPPQYALDAEALARRSLKVLLHGIGYHRVNLSAMLSGASWAVLCSTPLVPRGRRWLVGLVGLFIVYAQLMTAGRAGYGAWVAVGLFLAILRWRRFLLLFPVAGILVVSLAPGVVGRATEGFTAESHDANVELERKTAQDLNPNSEVDAYTVTAGRSVAWPVIIAAIKERPWVGYGRQAMLRAGPALYLYNQYHELFPHPHNAYLELLLDNGIVGFLIIMPFYLIVLFYSIRLFRDRESPTCVAVGGMSTALVMGLLVSAFGSQTFYPREGWVGMWCAIGLALRVRQQRLLLASAAEASQSVERSRTPAFRGMLAPFGPPVMPTAQPKRSPLSVRVATPTHRERSSTSLRSTLSMPASARRATAFTRRSNVAPRVGWFSPTVPDALVWQQS